LGTGLWRLNWRRVQRMSRKLELGLTPRELQVARLVRTGLTDGEIADRLFITRRTAEWHVKQILNKLGFNSRSQVAAWIAHDEAVGSLADSSGGHRHNLPRQLTTFIGRGTELAEIQRLLATTRFVTLTAVGGAGKTRLALEVANRALDANPDGAWIVDLSPIKDGRLVARQFGSTLGVHERPRQPIAETLVGHLRDRHLLLVVDNCEHVIEECAGLVNAILRSCPGITLLATSREPLRVNGETVWRVAPLAVPDPAAQIDVEDLARCEAVRLFVDRAQLAAPGFEMTAENAPALAELCRRLDGIPLAIELAAARAGMMSPGQILNRLQDRFGLLIGGSRTGPARHRTLQSAIDWSHDLLNDQERTLFRRSSVFAGSFSHEAIEQVCSGDGLEVEATVGLLGSLVDKSLVFVSEPLRLRLLETLQEYARKNLAESGESDAVNQRHCEFFVWLAEQAAPNLEGPEQQTWHRRLAQDIGNLRSALQWSSGHDPDANLRLSIALTYFWYIHGLVQEGDSWLTSALSKYAVRNSLRAQGLGHAGQFSYWRNDISAASACWHEGLDLYRKLGDRKGVGKALDWVSQALEWQGDYEKAHEYLDSALAIANEAQDTISAAHIFRHLGRLAMKEGDHELAQKYLEQAVSILERVGDQWRTVWALGYLGLNAIESGNLNSARSYLERALVIARTLELAIPTATMLMYFATLAAAQLHPVRALQLAGASESLAASAGAVPLRLTRATVERWLNNSRLQLGPGRSAACLAEGHAMSRERAIEYALKG
jgi:predicted ATPase/DNA-binding CsgD family transcriptional regulator